MEILHIDKFLHHHHSWVTKTFLEQGLLWYMLASVILVLKTLFRHSRSTTKNFCVLHIQWTQLYFTQ